ncbi:MAG: cytochrome c biogenesis protein CcsA [Neisseriaceae bacterium]|nr:cytochrome c biogenesis protein CcsA [Neisseriaceae bacterium]
MQSVLTIVLLLIYSGLGAYVWGFWRNRPSENYPLKKELMILAPVLLLHTWTVWAPLTQGGMVLFSFGQTLNLVTWLMVLMYFIGSFFYSLKGLQIILYPMTVISLFLVLIFPGHTSSYTAHHLPFILHVGSSILAYALFGIAMVLAALIFMIETDLRKRKMSLLMRFLPPLLSLEKLMFQAVWFGFILLTISVASGTIFSEAVFGTPFKISHKVVFGIASWVIYAFVLYGRVLRSWRGRKAAIWVIVGFFSLMLAYMGSRFVLEIILNRTV